MRRRSLAQLQRDALRSLAANLKRLRSERGMTQEELRAVSGLDVRHIQHIEAAEWDLRLSTLVKLCRALDVGIGDLFETTGS